MMRYLRLWKRNLELELAAELAYKGNFIIKAISLIMADIVGPLLAILIYANTAGIPGWKFEEFILFQGTFLLVFGVGRTVLFRLPGQVIEAVRDGSFDKYLVKPFNPLLQLSVSAWELDGFAEVLTGLALVIYGVVTLELFGWGILLYLLFVLVGVLFIYAMMIVVSALSFLVVKSWAIFDVFFRLSNFGRYPASIYAPGLRLFVTFLFPVAVAGFYPVESLLGKLPFIRLIEAIAPVILLFFVALWLWSLAMKKYSSAGG